MGSRPDEGARCRRQG